MTREELVVFASPPWGGPSYVESEIWDLGTAEPSIFDIVQHARTITNQICLFLPRTSNLEQIANLAECGERVGVDYMFANGYCKGMCVYLGVPEYLRAPGEHTELMDE